MQGYGLDSATCSKLLIVEVPQIGFPRQWGFAWALSGVTTAANFARGSTQAFRWAGATTQ